MIVPALLGAALAASAIARAPRRLPARRGDRAQPLARELHAAATTARCCATSRASPRWRPKRARRLLPALMRARQESSRPSTTRRRRKRPGCFSPRTSRSRAEGGRTSPSRARNERRARHGLGQPDARRARCGRRAKNNGRRTSGGAPRVKACPSTPLPAGSQRRHHREALSHPRGRARRSCQRAPERPLHRLVKGEMADNISAPWRCSISCPRALRSKALVQICTKRRGDLSLPGPVLARPTSPKRATTASSPPSTSATATAIRKESARRHPPSLRLYRARGDARQLRAPGGERRRHVRPGRPCAHEYGPHRRRARAMSVATLRHAGSLCVTTNK